MKMLDNNWINKMRIDNFKYNIDFKRGIYKHSILSYLQ